MLYSLAPFILHADKLVARNEMEEKRRLLQNTASVNDGYSKVSVDDILNFIGFGPLQVIAFCLAGLTTLTFGFDSTLFSFIGIPVQRKWNLTEIEYGILPSMAGVTNIFGAFFYGCLSDHFGRVWPYFLILLNVGLPSLASSFSPNFATLVVLRATTSFAVTAAAIIVFPTLIEFLPVRDRGKVLVLVIVIQAVGSCACAGLAWWLIPTYPTDGWRYLIIATAIPILFAALFRLVFYLQSPRFLLSKGRFKEARMVLSQMARVNGKQLSDFLPEDIDLEELIIMEAESNQSFWQTAKNFRVIFSRMYLRRTVLIGIIFPMQLAGYIGSSLFLPSVLNNLTHKPYFNAFVGYLGQIPGIVLMSIIVEWRHVGRLNSLRIFTALTVVSFLLFAFIQNTVSIPVITILIYFSMVPNVPLLFTYISECYPTSIRTFAVGFFNNLASLMFIVIPYVSGYVSDISITWLYPVVWAGLFGVQFIVTLFLNYETLGTELDDTVQNL